MNFKPIDGIDVGKFFSEMVILSPSNEVFARMKIHHDSNTDMKRATKLLKKAEVDARKITLLYRFHELKATNIPNEDIECLRSLCRQYYKLSDDLTAYKN